MKIQFSLRRLLAIVLLGGILFGSTFSIPNSGYIPRQAAIRQRRAHVDETIRYSGSEMYLGFPLPNVEVFTSADQDDKNAARTFEQTKSMVISGMIGNLAFWMSVAALLCWTASKVKAYWSKRRNECA